jgi:hypothetical protein
VQTDGRLPVPGPPCRTTSEVAGQRMISSCSAWMVATMSRISPERVRPSSASSGSGTPPCPAATESGSAKSASKISSKRRSSKVNRRRRLSPSALWNRGSVKGRRNRSSPVDHDRLVVTVLHVPATDVVARAILLVDTSEGKGATLIAQGPKPGLQLGTDDGRIDLGSPNSPSIKRAVAARIASRQARARST